jgi:hypothetical protein
LKKYERRTESIGEHWVSLLLSSTDLNARYKKKEAGRSNQGDDTSPSIDINLPGPTTADSSGLSAGPSTDINLSGPSTTTADSSGLSATGPSTDINLPRPGTTPAGLSATDRESSGSLTTPTTPPPPKKRPYCIPPPQLPQVDLLSDVVGIQVDPSAEIIEWPNGWKTILPTAIEGAANILEAVRILLYHTIIVDSLLPV